MNTIVRNLILTLAALVLFTYAAYPPKEKLKLGKDLRGGVSLVYAVQINSNEDSKATLSKMIEVIHDRLDPDGLMEISISAQGRDRLEITMPLPGPEVKQLKARFDDELAKLSKSAISETALDAAMRASGAEREARLTELAGGDEGRLKLLQSAATAADTMAARRAAYQEAETSGAPDADKMKLLTEATDADTAYEQARAAVLRTSVPAEELRRALRLAAAKPRLYDSSTKQSKEFPSPRETALERIRAEHPEAKDKINTVVSAYEAYAEHRKTLDDPQDLVRMLKGAGVLNFRITVDPGYNPSEEIDLRRDLRERGPRGVRSTDKHWYKLNSIDKWHDNELSKAEEMSRDPQGFFSRMGYIVDTYDGEYYMLCWDTRGTRLTQNEGNWGVERAYEGMDQLGKPAIHFEMNPRGAVLLGDLTKEHVQSKMAVLLDDQVYTAPTLQSAISRSGQITGNFSPEERSYVIRVLSAGSLQSKLSPEPISTSILGPDLGADNLRLGFQAGGFALIVVSAFMIFYYFTCGIVAVVGLIVNSIMILGAMALAQAAFTMPGIAGVILTFGQAVDANVLIYERMREELLRGADLKTALRLGFSRAFSPIMDGNISNLIICVVLYYLGTPEIRGFAVTLGIGVVTTLFSALVVSRLILDVLVHKLGWKHMSQLPMKFPAVQRLLTPNIDWMKHRHTFLGILIVFLVAAGAVVVQRGTRILGTEFRGGAEVELQFKVDESGKQVTLKRAEVHQRLVDVAAAAPAGDDLKKLGQAEVLPVNPEADGVTASRFRIRLGPANEKIILAGISNKFADVTGSGGAMAFLGAGSTEWKGHAYPILSRTLGENIDRPEVRQEVAAYLGGAAVVMQDLEPAPTRDALLTRLDRMRQQPEYADLLSRTRELRVLEGDDNAVKAAVLLVRDDSVNAFDSTERWENEIASREWRLVNDALTRQTQMASVQTFSPTIAASFAAKGVMTIVISLAMLTIYVWIRFGSPRWAIAATVPLFADVIGIAGLIGLAEVLYESPVTGDTARALGLLPFKFDLAQIAALLTIVGYSLNDKIIILDRIRENKGRLPYASYAMVNDSINHTLSRTLITAGTHLFTTVVLYIYGGEGVRGFAFAFNLGVVLGTYTSIVSSPLVWSHRLDPEQNPTPPATRGALAEA